MTYDLNGKHVLVTGASVGIGAGLAEGFARRGATVGICARRTDKLEEVLARCREHAPDSRAWTVDLADLDGIESFAAQANEELGGVDVLVNNAGIPKRRTVQALTPEVVESTMAIAAPMPCAAPVTTAAWSVSSTESGVSDMASEASVGRPCG